MTLRPFKQAGFNFYYFYSDANEAELNLEIFFQRSVSDMGREYYVNFVKAPYFGALEYPCITKYAKSESALFGISYWFR